MNLPLILITIALILNLINTKNQLNKLYKHLKYKRNERIFKKIIRRAGTDTNQI